MPHYYLLERHPTSQSETGVSLMLPPGPRLIKKLMRIHGKFVGPNWSAGKHQGSVPYGRVRAVDEFDLSAKFHDHAYATGMDRKKADYLFYKWNVGKGFKRTAAALAVGLQGSLRSSQKNNKMAYPTPVSGRKRTNSGTVRAPRMSNRGPYNLKKYMKNKGAVRRTKRIGKTAYLASSGSKVYKKKGRKVKKGLTNMEKYGTRAVAEWRLSVSSTTCCYIGHTSVVRDNGYWTLSRAIVKLLALRNGMAVNDFDAIIPGSGAPGDQWALTYLNGLDFNDSIQVFNYVTVGVYSLEIIAIKFKEHLEAITAKPNLTITGASFIAVGNSWSRASISLKEALIHLDFRSHLKFQNRTVSSSGSTSTDIIDSNPLIGRQYFGRGTGTIHNVDTSSGQSQFIADRTSGTILFDGSSVNTLKEPPPPKQLTNVSNTKGARMVPGEIQTSVLVLKRAMPLNTFLNYLKRQSNNTGADDQFLINLGNFRLFAFEKVMYDISEQDIDISFELQQTTSSYISRTTAPLTAQIITNL